MTITIEEETKVDFDFDYKKVIEDVINQAMDYKNCPYEAEVSVTLTDNESIHAINKEFRNIDNPTDVLSFPLVDYEEAGEFDNSFIILDEAQNTTPAQMKMFLTRIGFGSKVVITGDLTQKDLPHDQASGLDTALKVLRHVEEIGICRLTSSDVVRHPLVQKIVKAYDEYEDRKKPAVREQSDNNSDGSARKKVKTDKQKKRGV